MANRDPHDSAMAPVVKPNPSLGNTSKHYPESSIIKITPFVTVLPRDIFGLPM